MVGKTKNRVPKQGKWDPKSMLMAFEDVKANRLTVRKAAKQYGVPRSTLQRRLSGQVEVTARAARPTVLTVEEEIQLRDYILYMESVGFGLTLKDTCALAFQMAEMTGRPHPFNKERKQAGFDWFCGFRERHPQLSLRKPEGLSAARAAMLNPTVIREHFDKLGKLMETLNIKDKPSQIFNADETGLSLVHTPSKIVSQKGKRTVQSKTSGDRGENVTVLGCASADGRFLPPFIIFKGQRLSDTFTANAPANTLFGVSKSSFIDTDLFETWFQKCFIQEIGPKRPVLLVLDGHASHISIATIKRARENDIHLYCLPPHTTNHLQPLDKCVFKSVKSQYNRSCEAFLKKNPGKVITRYDFCGLFKDVFYKTCTIGNAVSGFSATGIYPFDPSKVKVEHMQFSEIETVFVDAAQEPPAEASQHINNNNNNNMEEASTSQGYNAVEAMNETPSSSNTIAFTEILKRPSVEKVMNGKKSRRVTSSRCLTSDEILNELEAKEKAKKDVEAEKLKKKEEREAKRVEKEKERQAKQDQKEKKKQLKLGGKCKQKSNHLQQESQQRESDFCIHCNGYYWDDEEDDDDWIQCKGPCKLWAHETCTGLFGKPDALAKFVCSNCSNN